MIKHALLLSFLLITNLGICADPEPDRILINITGNIVPSPCVVAEGYESISVNLGDNISADKLESNSHSDWILFTLKLTKCQPNIVESIATFTGTPDDDNNDFYKNTGDAENIAIEVKSEDDTQLLKHTSTWTLPVNNGEVIWNMKARLVSKGDVVPGTVNTTITVTFTYP